MKWDLKQEKLLYTIYKWIQSNNEWIMKELRKTNQSLRKFEKDIMGQDYINVWVNTQWSMQAQASFQMN